MMFVQEIITTGCYLALLLVSANGSDNPRKGLPTPWDGKGLPPPTLPYPQSIESDSENKSGSDLSGTEVDPGANQSGSEQCSDSDSDNAPISRKFKLSEHVIDWYTDNDFNGNVAQKRIEELKKRPLPPLPLTPEQEALETKKKRQLDQKLKEKKERKQKLKAEKERKEAEFLRRLKQRQLLKEKKERRQKLKAEKARKEAEFLRRLKQTTPNPFRLRTVANNDDDTESECTDSESTDSNSTDANSDPVSPRNTVPEHTQSMINSIPKQKKKSVKRSQTSVKAEHLTKPVEPEVMYYPYRRKVVD